MSIENENLTWLPTVSKDREIAYQSLETEKNTVIAYIRNIETGDIKEVRVKTISAERLAEIKDITNRLDNGFK